MSRLFPYPWATAALLVMWLLLTESVSIGQLLLGSVVAVLGSLVLVPLQVPRARIRRLWAIPGLAARVLIDVIRSNFAVAWILLRPGQGKRHAGFVTIQLELRDPYGLAVLAAIITSTPGTIWVRFDPNQGELVIHVLDLVDEESWIRTIKDRYERRLREIFE